MALKVLGSALSALKPVIARATDRHGHGVALDGWRTWYSTAEWKALRRRVFVRDHYTCQMQVCGRVVGRPIADHVQPHRGDRALFFDDANVQTLCKPCHDSLKQAEERRARLGR